MLLIMHHLIRKQSNQSHAIINHSYQVEKQGLERLSNVPMVTQLIKEPGRDLTPHLIPEPTLLTTIAPWNPHYTKHTH